MKLITLIVLVPALLSAQEITITRTNQLETNIFTSPWKLDGNQKTTTYVYSNDVSIVTVSGKSATIKHGSKLVARYEEMWQEVVVTNRVRISRNDFHVITMSDTQTNWLTYSNRWWVCTTNKMK